MKKIKIGTSGYNYQHWRGVFYPKDLPEKKWLEFYAKVFNTVELNVTFYRLPKMQVFEGWRERVPKNFRYAVKGSRFITHIKKLKDCQDPVRIFYKNAKALGEKLLVILWQLPPNLKVDHEKLEKFVKFLPAGRHAFEFREKSWFCKAVYDILKKNRMSLVLADSPSWPYEEILTAAFVYIRMHGGRSLYGSKYSDKELKVWAEKIKKWGKDRDIFVYFNNDTHGYAVENAKKLRELLNV